MLFEWDEVKRQRIIAERGVDLLHAALIFEGVILTRRDDRHDYGEERMISLGMVENECFVVVHTQRGDIMRLITAWRGGRYDQDIYQARIAGRAAADEG